MVVLLSVFNGFIIALLSMLGEYVVRTLNAVSVQQPSTSSTGSDDRPRVSREPSTATCWSSAPSAAARPTSPRARRAPGGSRWRVRRRPEPKVFCSAELERPQGPAWYDATWFAHAAAEAVLGEKSTSYLEARGARAAAAVLGDVRLVVQLRDPVDRAVSNWRFSTRQRAETAPARGGPGRQPRGSAAVGPARSPRSRRTPISARPLRRGRSALAATPSATVQVQFLEDLLADPRGGLDRDCCAHARVSTRDGPAEISREPVNASDLPTRRPGPGPAGRPARLLPRQRQRARVRHRTTAALGRRDHAGDRLQ